MKNCQKQKSTSSRRVKQLFKEREIGVINAAEEEFYAVTTKFARFMKKEQHDHIKQKLSSLLMLLMLAWLTICLPCVTENSQHMKDLVQLIGEETPDSDDSNPLANTNEEKSESGGSLLSEYLHHLFQIEHTFTNIASFYKFHPSELYLAYHPKLIIPPPEL